MNLRQQLDYLFNPSSVALIGASNNLAKWGFHVLSLLIAKGGRPIYPINKNEDEVQGLKAYQSVSQVPGAVDLAVITVPFSEVPAAMRDCARKGVKVAVVIPGGFAETGNEGARIQREVVEIARQGGIRLVGPNGMGHFNTSADFFTVPYLPPVKKGPLALIAQSGNTSQSIVYLACEMGLGFSKYVSSGNEADLHFEDYMEYLGQDEETKIILGYIEGLKEGRRFFELAKEITRKKPVVIMKAGRTVAGARAAWSHTAALSWVRRYLRGSIQAIRRDQSRRSERTNRCGISSSRAATASRQEGRGALGGRRRSRDSCGCPDEARIWNCRSYLQSTIEKLNSLLPPRWSHGNPVETGGDPFSYSCLWALIEDENVDAALVIGGGGVTGSYAKWVSLPASVSGQIDQWLEDAEVSELDDVDKSVELMKKYQKPIIFANMGVPTPRKGKIYEKLQQKYIIPFLTPERAAKALSHLVQYSEYVRG